MFSKLVLRDSTNADGPKMAQLQTFIRLLAFFWGLLPQAVKLLTSTGIRWTIFAASLYLASFIVFELLLFLGGQLHLSKPKPVVDRKFLRTMDSMFAECAFCANYVFLIWAVYDIIYTADLERIWPYFTPGFYLACIMLSMLMVTVAFSPALIIGSLLENCSKTR
jgi:hypothetical protein